MKASDQFTEDRFLNGRLFVRQDRLGYRFSIDAVIVAHYLQPSPGDTVVDLGTGCGIIPLIVSFRNPDVRIIGVELVPEVADIAAANVAENGLEKNVSVVCKDMKSLPASPVTGPVAWVVSNPPYRRAFSGRINPDSRRALARHEISVTMPDVIDTARRLLKTGGKLVLIYPTERLGEVISEMRRAGIEAKALRCIHPTMSSDANLAIVEGAKGGRPGMKVLPPLAIYNGAGCYTHEVAAMMRP